LFIAIECYLLRKIKAMYDERHEQEASAAQLFTVV